MSMVSSELGVGTLEGGVTRSLGLLNTARESATLSTMEIRDKYPFLCALRDWLCWELFFDSAIMSVIWQFPLIQSYSRHVLAIAAD